MSTQPHNPQNNRYDRDGETLPAPAAEPAAGNVQASKKAEELDSLLDEIDTVLESNAEEFVKGFVQKGGQ